MERAGRAAGQGRALQRRVRARGGDTVLSGAVPYRPASLRLAENERVWRSALSATRVESRESRVASRQSPVARTGEGPGAPCP